MSGLENVVVAETEMSMVDGAKGALWLRGVPVAELAPSVETALSLFGLSGDLESARVSAQAHPQTVVTGPPIDSVRATVASLPSDASPATLIATVALATARSVRASAEFGGQTEHAAALLRAIRRSEVTTAEARAFARYLVTVADHGMNASTFAARVVASTGSDLVSAVTAALGALKGPLHGGAPGPVLDMLDAIAESGDAIGYLEAKLARKERIMGMGHRVYRVRDPRAAVLSGALEELAAGAPSPRLALAREVEQVAERLLAARYPERSLRANVEFYTAILLEALQIPRELFTCVFACGRVIGWCAHFEEQQRTGRLLRPRAKYVGAVPTREFSCAADGE